MLQGSSNNCKILEQSCRVTTELPLELAIVSSLIQDKIPWMGEFERAACEKSKGCSLLGWIDMGYRGGSRWGEMPERETVGKQSTALGKDKQFSLHGHQFMWRVVTTEWSKKGPVVCV